jgi:2-C-methyl-D-erythritol 4-phosphate cytidylyltransferase
MTGTTAGEGYMRTKDIIEAIAAIYKYGDADFLPTVCSMTGAMRTKAVLQHMSGNERINPPIPAVSAGFFMIREISSTMVSMYPDRRSIWAIQTPQKTMIARIWNIFAAPVMIT